MVIGFLMLMGIVTKNAIMLVEFALEGMKEGMDKHEAMAEAGHKARPAHHHDDHRDGCRHGAQLRWRSAWVASSVHRWRSR